MIFPGTAQNGMFQNMRHSRIIGRRRTKADGEYLVVILIRQIEKTRTAHFVLHEIRR